MKLHAVNRKLPVLQTHDLAGVGCGGDFERFGKRLAFHDQGMIAGRFERLSQIPEHAAMLMMNLRRLAVHQFVRAHNFAAENLRDALMAKTNAENRNRLSELAN